MVQDTIPLLDRLSDHPLKDPNLTGQMSLLERMGIKPFAQNSVPLSPSTEKRDYQSQKHSRKSVHSSTKISSSPIPRKRKLSTYMLMNSTPSITMPGVDYSQCPYPKRRKQSTTQYTRSSTRSPTELSVEKSNVMIPREKNQTMSMKPLIRNPRSKSPTWDGMIQMNLPSTATTLSTKKLVDFSESTTKTSPEPNSSSELLDAHPKESPLLNGSEYLEEKSSTSTSTTSSCLCTVLQLLKRERHVLATQKSALESLMQKGVLALPPNGLPLGTSPLGQLLSLSLTAQKNYASMGTLLAPNSQEKSQVLTPELSSSISPFETLSKEDINTFSPTVPSTFGSIQQSLCPTESKQILPRALIGDRPNHVLAAVKQTSVTDSTLPMDVPLQTQFVNTVTSAKTARRESHCLDCQK